MHRLALVVLAAAPMVLPSQAHAQQTQTYEVRAKDGTYIGRTVCRGNNYCITFDRQGATIAQTRREGQYLVTRDNRGNVIERVKPQ